MKDKSRLEKSIRKSLGKITEPVNSFISFCEGACNVCFHAAHPANSCSSQWPNGNDSRHICYCNHGCETQIWVHVS